MCVSDELSKFLNAAKILSNSSIILTDLEKVVFADLDTYNDNDYLNGSLSEDLKQILNLYINDISTVDYMNTTMTSIVPITCNDNSSTYKSQIILPIMHNNVIVGLLIFIAHNRKYLPSSLAFAKSTRHFTEEFINKSC